MNVLLDANTLISQHFLKGHLGVALVFAVRKRNGRIILPETTELEAMHHTLRLYSERKTDVEKTTDQLQVILGKRPNIEWPDPGTIRAALEKHLEAIADILERRPLEMDVVRSAISRVIEKRPPAHIKEEFRDSLFWETAVRLGNTTEVHLVTEDSDFLVSKDGTKSLNAALTAEISSGNLKLSHHLTISALLESLGPGSLQPDPNVLASALERPLRDLLRRELASKGITLQQQLTPQAKAFATPDPNRLALSFDVPFQASAATSASSSPSGASVNVIGSASLDPRTNKLVDVELDKVNVAYDDGGSGGISFLRSSTSTQDTWTPYSFRFPLDR